MLGKKIFVIEDDESVRQLVAQAFTRQGGLVEVNAGQVNPLRRFFEFQPDLVLLDIMLPAMDGWEIARQMRQLAGTPIIVITALSDEKAALQAYEVGADAFVIKPFSVKALLAQAKAILQRAEASAQKDTRWLYVDPYLIVDIQSRQVIAGGRPVILTRTEFRLLRLLLVNRDRIVPFAEILLNVWGAGYQDEIGYVHTYISRLRRKLEPDSPDAKYLIGERGVGYGFASQS